MRSLILLILVCIFSLTHGQEYDPCIPIDVDDSLKIYNCYENAQYYFSCQDYLKAAYYMHEAEKILPHCTDIIESLTVCYWEYYQDSYTYDIRYMLQAKKYLELCLHYGFSKYDNDILYQNCLNEINVILEKKLERKIYSDGIYYGEMTDNKRDGYGIFSYDNGLRYEGLWADDKKADIDGVLYDSNGNLIYKGGWANDEVCNYSKSYYNNEVNYWKTIENSNDTTAYRMYLDTYGDLGMFRDQAYIKIADLKMSENHAIVDTVTNIDLYELHRFISSVEKDVEDEKYERNFLDFSYSLSGRYTFRYGSMYKSRWGFYNGVGVSDMKLDNSINGMRYTLGLLYAPSNWMYLYAGGGFLLDTISANNNYKIASELGLQLRAGAVSFSAGVQVDDLMKDRSVDLNFGFGFNVNAYRRSYEPFTYYVYSPMAQYGFMMAWYRNSYSGYFKLQIPMYGEKIRDVIGPSLKNRPVRYSLTAGTTMSVSSWLGFYTGLGVGMYKDSITDNNRNRGLDAEIGISLRISDVLSVSAGIHGVNVTEKERSLTYDFAIGASTWDLFAKRTNHTIWEYSVSETADVGFMSGFIYNWIGYYSRVQLTNPFDKKKVYLTSDKWKGKRYSFMAGPIISLTDWLMIHGGIGAGLYIKDDGEQEIMDMGFETELGVNLRVWLVEFSFGPHWCRNGKDDAYLDYNLGIGLDVPIWLYNSYFENSGMPFMRLRYSKNAQLGFDVGFVHDIGGLYMGFQGGIGAKSLLRINMSAGVIFTPSALIHFSIGPGVGLYEFGPPTGGKFGFDMEAMVTLVIWKIPVTIGVKMCRIGSPDTFMETIYGIGLFDN